MSDYKMYIGVFVSTGDLQAMFTLRTYRSVNGFYVESYIKNLSTDFDKAEALAKAYAENLNERIGGRTCEVRFEGVTVDEIFKRRGKLSVRDTYNIERVEAGFVPFGKHRDQKIADLPDTYILWLTDQLQKSDLDPVFFTLASVASGIAQERDLLAKREVARAEKLEQDLKSVHFGEIGQRYEEDVDVVRKYKVDTEGWISWKYEIRLGDSILTHNGKTELPQGPCRLKFTVKFQFETKNGVKKTYINRPAVVKVRSSSPDQFGGLP